MGWTSKYSWTNTQMAIEDESRPNDLYEIVWHNSHSYIYLEKATKKPIHSYFLSRRDKDGIWIKDIGDFREASAARKFKEYAVAYIKTNPNGDYIKYINERIKECDELIAYENKKKKLKTLKVGDTAYIKEHYKWSGKCIIYAKPAKHSRSYIVMFDGNKKVSCTTEAFDLDKTFEN